MEKLMLFFSCLMLASAHMYTLEQHGYPVETIELGSRDTERDFVRIHFHYFDWETKNSEREAYHASVTSAVTEYVQRTFKTNRLSTNPTLSLTDATCAGHVISSNENDNMNNYGTEIKIIISTGDVATSTEWASWAAPCLVDANNLNQAFMGRIVINQENLADQTIPEQISDLMRLTFQVMGFHSNLYDYWRDANGDLYGDCLPTKQIHIRDKTVWSLATPNLLTQARSEFNCETITGLELEWNDTCTTAGYHWEKRIMYNDIMTTPDARHLNFVSKITLAAMADSGWYTIVEGSGENILWGRNRGCTFLEWKCVNHGGPLSDEFCVNNSSYTQCDFSHSSIGRCQLGDHFCRLPPAYRYFTDNSVGGTDQDIDFCPIVEAEDDGHCQMIDGEKGDGAFLTHLGERRDVSSRCLEGTLTGPGEYPRIHAGCYRIQCDDAAVNIEVGSHTVQCPLTNWWSERVEVPGYGGFLNCPNPDIICDYSHSCSDNCHFNGTCVAGACVCATGVTGDYCESPPLAENLYVNDLTSTQTCDDGYFYDASEIYCEKCHHSCSTCSGTGEDECTSCHLGNAMADDDLNRCVRECATGYTNFSNGVCVLNCTWCTSTFKFDVLEPSFNDGDNLYTLHGGVAADDLWADDPILIQNRGYWFDGIRKHMTLNNMVFHYTHTLEFFLKSHMASGQTAALLGSYRDAYHPSLGYESQMSLFITDNAARLEVKCESDHTDTVENILQEREWGYIQLAVTYSAGTSSVILFKNSCVQGTITFDFVLLDSLSICKFFGGIRQGYNVHNGFRGYMAEITIGNRPYTGIDQFNQYTGECLLGPCDACSSSWDNQCLPTCAMNEIAVAHPAGWGCDMCRGKGNCNSCLDKCYPCFGMHKDWCDGGS